MKTASLILASLLSLAALYTATIGPAWALTQHEHLSRRAFETFYSPLLRFEDHCPGDLLWKYQNWWSPKFEFDLHL